MSKSEVSQFISDAAVIARCTPDELLGRVLHVNAIEGDKRFDSLLGSSAAGVRAWIVKLDLFVRLRNPGLHYVFRSQYFGYRREDIPGSRLGSARLQVFLSVIPRTATLELVLPLEPADYKHVPNCRSVATQGHHGVGDLAFKISQDSDVALFVATFKQWIQG